MNTHTRISFCCCLREGEDVHGVVVRLNLYFREFAQEFGDLEVVAGHYCYVLFSFYCISYRADRDVAAQDGFPEFFTCYGIKGSEAAVHIAIKDEIARGGEHGAIGGNAADIEAQHLAGCEVDLS